MFNQPTINYLQRNQSRGAFNGQDVRIAVRGAFRRTGAESGALASVTMETTEESLGEMLAIRPPRLEDAGLEDCALPPDKIREAFARAADSLKSRLAIASDEDESDDNDAQRTNDESNLQEASSRVLDLEGDDGVVEEEEKKAKGLREEDGVVSDDVEDDRKPKGDLDEFECRFQMKQQSLQ
ncbi:hypothetical protein IHE45_20G059200 [Dioscorea alata]|uniref:Uncharacterized protein n=1 Tax=Dioscorea alata TaxID=55571 RepID=A0ACB7TSA1_DIOAL|nr:hypothetical protein IHE45_20G059200 [Dioscorea alata]